MDRVTVSDVALKNSVILTLVASKIGSISLYSISTMLGGVLIFGGHGISPLFGLSFPCCQVHPEVTSLRILMELATGPGPANNLLKHRDDVF